MAVPVPRLDDRSYEQILADAKARIPVHTPEWTNFNDSDPGVTLLQLTSWIVENALYRINLIPERNRRKFLQLLGIGLLPASAATGVAVLSNDRGRLQTLTLPAGLSISAGPTGFASGNALDVLPLEALPFYRRRITGDAEVARVRGLYEQLYGSYADDDTELDYYQTTRLAAPTAPVDLPKVDIARDTVDGSLWLALLTRPGEAGRVADVRAELGRRTLTLGLMPAAGEPGRVLQPGGAEAAAAITLAYDLATGETADGTAAGAPVYEPLTARTDGNPLRGLTLVQLTLPAATRIGSWDILEPLTDGVGDYPPVLDDADLRARLVTWLRISIRPAAPGLPLPAGLSVGVHWAGINAVRVRQQQTVSAELVGTGSGEPDQRVFLINRPVIEGSVALLVGGERWTVTDDLLAAPPEVGTTDPALPPGSPSPRSGDPRLFTLDRQSGEISFGDGLRGARPRRGAPILASYAYGGTRAGNVGIAALNASPALPAGFKVSNPLPTWGGTDGETVAEAERAIPRVLRHRNRAVAREDFEDIVRNTPGIDLGRVEIRAEYHPEAGAPSPGAVTAVVIPRDPSRPEGAEADTLFLDAICRYLEPRRLLTTEVHVRGPRYVDIVVSVGVDIESGRDEAIVREAVKAEIRRFLSPLAGGFERQGRASGWPFDHAVEDREVLVRAARVAGVTAVRGVLLWIAGSREPVATIPISGLQLPRLTRVEVASGDAENVFAVTAPPATAKPKRRLPVPTLPPDC